MTDDVVDAWETRVFILIHVLQAILLVAVLFLVLWTLSGGSV